MIHSSKDWKKFIVSTMSSSIKIIGSFRGEDTCLLMGTQLKIVNALYFSKFQKSKESKI